MVDRFVSEQLELPEQEDDFTRADLIFYGLDHSGHSYEGRVFLNNTEADHETGRGDESYIGSFWIFGHGGCFGDVGHCDIPNRDDPFDLRPPHQLEPATRVLTVTEAIKTVVRGGTREATVTVVAHTAGERENDVLAFETIRLAVYGEDLASREG